MADPVISWVPVLVMKSPDVVRTPTQLLELTVDGR